MNNCHSFWPSVTVTHIAMSQWHSRRSAGTVNRFHDLHCSCLVRGVSGEIPHCIGFQQNFEEGACLTIVSINHGFGVRIFGVQFNINSVCFTTDFYLHIHWASRRSVVCAGNNYVIWLSVWKLVDHTRYMHTTVYGVQSQIWQWELQILSCLFVFVCVCV